MPAPTAPLTKLLWAWSGPLLLFYYCLVERVRAAVFVLMFIWLANGVIWCKSPKLRFFYIQMLPFCLISENSLLSALTVFGFVLLGWNMPFVLILLPGFCDGKRLCTELLRLPSPLLVWDEGWCCFCPTLVKPAFGSRLLLFYPPPCGGSRVLDV